jgi:hypothetical protein
MASVFRRRDQEGAAAGLLRDLYARFHLDAAAFEVVSVTNELIRAASELVLDGHTGSRTRSLDAIQLATARWWFEQAALLNIEPGAFVVADRPLRDAAVALGIAVENPEDYE